MSYDGLEIRALLEEAGWVFTHFTPAELGEQLIGFDIHGARGVTFELLNKLSAIMGTTDIRIDCCWGINVETGPNGEQEEPWHAMTIVVRFRRLTSV